MEKKYEICFEKYIQDIVGHCKNFCNNLDEMVLNQEMEEFIKKSRWRYIKEEDLYWKDFIKRLYIWYLTYEVWFEDMYSYYMEYIYMDKYWIWDFFIEKDNPLVVDKLYNRKVQVEIRNFMWMNYPIFQRLSVSHEQKFNDVLEFLYLQLRRWNIKVRALDVKEWYETVNTDWCRNINIYEMKKRNKILEYKKDDADKMLKELKEMYLNVYDKDTFIDCLVEITLSENQWADGWVL